MRDGKNIMTPTNAIGNKESLFKELFTYRESVFLVCLGYTKCYSDAEELTQDIYVKTWEKLDRINKEISIKGWLLTITRNRCVDHFRREKVKRFFLESEKHGIESPICNDTPEINIQLKEDKANLRECINSLSERLRSVFVLREYGGNSCEEISDILNIQLGTVYSRLNRAKNKVTKLMGDINGQS